jgi:hypothetical protein
MINFTFGAIVGGFIVYINPSIVDSLMNIVKGVI